MALRYFNLKLVARVTRTEGTVSSACTRASAVSNCQLALAWCLLRWSCHDATGVQKLPSFSMTGATSPMAWCCSIVCTGGRLHRLEGITGISSFFEFPQLGQTHRARWPRSIVGCGADRFFRDVADMRQ